MTGDPTKPEFYGLWSVRQLQVECARLNQVLVDCHKIASSVETISSYERTGGLEEIEERGDDSAKDEIINSNKE